MQSELSHLDSSSTSALGSDVLVFAGDQFERLRSHILRDRRETAAFVLAAAVLTPRGMWRLLVRDVVKVRQSDYVVRTESHIELPPTVVAKVLERARRERLSVTLVHSHPRGDSSPSPIDLGGEKLLVPALQRRIPDIPHARLIIGQNSQHAAIFLPTAAAGHKPVERILRIISIGPEVTDIPVLQHGDVTEVPRTNPSARSVRNPAARTAQIGEEYDRQIRAFGQDGQRRLQGLRMAVVGLGGTGSIVAQQLAHLGVRDFLLVDPDTVDTSNLNRLAGARPSDIGTPKVEVAANHIRAINPAATVEIRREDICVESTARRLLDTDVFFSCTDTHGSRWVLTQLAYQYLVPGFDIGVVIQTDAERVTHIAGRVQMLAPSLPCLVCGNLLDSEQVRRDMLTMSQRTADPYIRGAAVHQPAVISINGVASSLAVTMFLSAFVGIPGSARYLQLRLESGIVSRIEASPTPNCVVCSTAGLFAVGDSGARLGRPDTE